MSPNSREGVEHRHVISVNPRVGGHERESFLPRLGDEQPVERVAVMQRKARDGESMVCGQSEDADARLEDLRVQIVEEPRACRRPP